MNQIYHTDKNRFIVYNTHKSNKKNAPYVIFLHGLMSDMNGSKAQYIEKYCQKHDYNFLRFDNFGHGGSSQKFLDCTISDWLQGLELVLEELKGEQFILIGSSMGAWIALLAALKSLGTIKALICIAPAPDFTEESIWQQLAPLQKEQMQKEGWLNVSGRNCEQKYPISYQLIQDAKQHLLLNQEQIKLNIPTHLIHGMLDSDVPYTVSERLLQKITSKVVVLKLIKDGDHKLSRPEDLQIITNSLEEVLSSVIPLTL